MSTNAFKPISRKNDLITQNVGKEILIYDLSVNKAFSFNEPLAVIWQSCDGERTVSELAGDLTGKFNSPVNEDFIWLALHQLKKDNLIENNLAMDSPFEGLSRREMIRKVGLGSLLALPIASVLVAPTAIQAASACPAAACRCPNGSATCPGSTSPGFVNCNSSTGNNACDCKGPFGAADSAGAGFKTGTCSL